MRPIVILAVAFLTLALSAIAVNASDPTACYAFVEKVIFEPNDTQPERVQVWGAFTLAKPNDRNDYLAPQRGYLYFKMPQDKQDQVRKQWADLKSVAGTHKVVAFGSRYDLKVHVRKAEEKPSDPDLFETGYGMVRVRTETEYAPVKTLLLFSEGSGHTNH
jgi:hypothetical protein